MGPADRHRGLALLDRFEAGLDGLLGNLAILLCAVLQQRRVLLVMLSLVHLIHLIHSRQHLVRHGVIKLATLLSVLGQKGLWLDFLQLEFLSGDLAGHLLSGSMVLHGWLCLKHLLGHQVLRCHHMLVSLLKLAHRNALNAWRVAKVRGQTIRAWPWVITLRVIMQVNLAVTLVQLRSQNRLAAGLVVGP